MRHSRREVLERTGRTLFAGGPIDGGLGLGVFFRVYRLGLGVPFRVESRGTYL